MASGRQALFNILRTLDLEPGDEVIFPLFTFKPLPDLVKKLGYVIKFVDLKSGSLNIDISSLRSCITPKTKVIVATHLGGIPCAIDEVMEVALKHNIIVIEDCAHAVGVKYKDRTIGSFGDFAFFGFGPTKMLSTFEGGMVLCKSREHFLKLNLIIRKCVLPGRMFILKKLIRLALYSIYTNQYIHGMFIVPISRFLRSKNKDLLLMVKSLKKREFYLEYRLFPFQAEIGLRHLACLDNSNEIIKNNYLYLLRLCGKGGAINESKYGIVPYLLHLEVNNRKEFIDFMSTKKINFIIPRYSYFYSSSEISSFPNASDTDNKLVNTAFSYSLTRKDVEYIAKAILAYKGKVNFLYETTV